MLRTLPARLRLACFVASLLLPPYPPKGGDSFDRVGLSVVIGDHWSISGNAGKPPEGAALLLPSTLKNKTEGEAFGVRPSEKVEGASPSKHPTEGGACELIIYGVNCVVSTQFLN